MKKHLKQDLNLRKSTKNRIKTRYWLLLPAILLLGTLLLPVLRHYQAAEPQRLLTKGFKLEGLGRAQEALRDFRLLLKEYPESEEAAVALYRLARLWEHDLLDPQRALLKYLQLELDYPDSKEIHLAREAAARIVKYNLRDDMQAIGYYQLLLDSRQGLQDQYLYEIADCYFRLENYSQARIELENLLAEYPKSPLAADVLHRKATILTIESRIDEAQQDWQSLIDQYPDSTYQSQARFNLANLLEEKGELEQALDEYLQLEDFSRPLLLEQKINHLKRRIEVKNKGLE